MAFFLIILPLANIPRPISMMVHTFAIGLVVSPLTLIDITISMHELAEALCETIAPLTIEACTIGPLLHTVAIALVSLPLACVLDPMLEQHGRSLDALL
jgi:hypothetical protein